MDTHTISALNRLEVVETGRRRRWSEEEKARIVLESMSGPRLVSATARRHGLSRSLLVTWRRAQGFDGRNSETGFVPAMIAADAPAAPATSSSRLEATNGSERRIEIALACGRRVFLMRASTLKRSVGSLRFWIADDSCSNWRACGLRRVIPTCARDSRRYRYRCRRCCGAIRSAVTCSAFVDVAAIS